MGKFGGRKILGVILFCFVLSALYSTPVKAIRNNSFTLAPISKVSESPSAKVNKAEYYPLEELLVNSTSLKAAELPLIIPSTSNLAVGEEKSQTFTSSGSFTPPAGVTTVTVEIWGGGGTTTLTSLTPGISIPVTVGTVGTSAISKAGIASYGDGSTSGYVKITWECPVYNITGISSETSICEDEPAKITVISTTAADLPVGGYVVFYTLSGTNTGSGNATMTVNTPGTGTFSITFLNGGETTISITSLSSGGTPQICSSEISISKTVTVTPNNTIALSSAPTTDSQVKCINTAINPITYATTGATGATFSGLPAGVTGTWASNQVTISGTPTVGQALTSYMVTLTGGCGNITATGTITISPLPTPTIGGSNSACLGSTGNIYSTETGMSDYIWTVSPGGTITSGVGTNSITVTWGIAGSQEVRVNYRNGNGCIAASPTIKTVIVNPIPTVVITNPAAVCTPSTVDITAQKITAGSTTGLTYSYWTDAFATNALSNPTSVGAGTYWIKGTTAAGCSSIQSVTVTVYSNPTLVITNPAAVCSPATVDLSAASITTGSSAGLIYTYYTDATATNELSNFSTVGNGTYYIKGTNNNGCYEIKPVTVIVNPTPTVTTANAKNICTGSNTDIVLTANVPSAFSWTIGSISGIVNGASAGSGNIISQTLTSSGNGGTVVYLVTPVSTTGNCTGATFPITVTVQTSPAITQQPEVTNVVCQGGFATFTAYASGLPTPTVQWQVSPTGSSSWTSLTDNSNVSGATTNLLTISNPIDGYKYRAVFTNTSVCTSKSVTSGISTIDIIGNITIKTQFSIAGCGVGMYTLSIEIQGDQDVLGWAEWESGTTWVEIPGSRKSLINGTPIYSYSMPYGTYPDGTKFRIHLESKKCTSNFDSNTKYFGPQSFITTSNTCIGTPITFTQDGTAGGTWWVTPGSGTINSAGYFVPAAPGNWQVKYTALNGCTDTRNFVVFPASPNPVIANTCDTKLVIPTLAPVTGFTEEYAIKSPGGNISSYGTLAQANGLLANIPGCWTIYGRYKSSADWGTTPANTVSPCAESTINAVVFPAAPALTAPSNTCASAFLPPSVPAINGFNIEWSIDGLAFTSTPSYPSIPGCHTLRARYASATPCGNILAGTSGPNCESNVVSVVVFPEAPLTPTLVPIDEFCGAFTVTPPATIPGFDIEYSFNNGATWDASNMSPTVENCNGYIVRTRYVLADNCGSTAAKSASSNATCKESQFSIRKIDTTGPEFLVTPPSKSFCVESIKDATYNGEPEPDADINEERPDWYLLQDGDMDIDAISNSSDNCTLQSELTLHWRIDFAATPTPLASISGTGRFSTYGSPIIFYGDGVNFTDVKHTITYWIEDACGNESVKKTAVVTIMPRPKIEKL